MRMREYMVIGGSQYQSATTMNGGGIELGGNCQLQRVICLCFRGRTGFEMSKCSRRRGTWQPKGNLDRHSLHTYDLRITGLLLDLPLAFLGHGNAKYVLRGNGGMTFPR